MPRRSTRTKRVPDFYTSSEEAQFSLIILAHSKSESGETQYLVKWADGTVGEIPIGNFCDCQSTQLALIEYWGVVKDMRTRTIEGNFL